MSSGVLAQWDGKAEAWTIGRRNQFTEVTGPGGIYGNSNPATDPVWTVGWDYRSLILMWLDHGRWQAYRLPKAGHTYDGAHGWYTEWPRIRDIGEEALLMTMHGSFWRFPKTFSASNSAVDVPILECSTLTAEQILSRIKDSIRSIEPEGKTIRIRLENVPVSIQRGIDFQHMRNLSKNAVHFEIKSTTMKTNGASLSEGYRMKTLADEFIKFLETQAFPEKERIAKLGLHYINKNEERNDLA